MRHMSTGQYAQTYQSLPILLLQVLHCVFCRIVKATDVFNRIRDNVIRSRLRSICTETLKRKEVKFSLDFEIWFDTCV